MSRPVTEADFRRPEFRDANPEDYEFRGDGRIVRKDRWETTVRNIAAQFGAETREGFECHLLEFSVEDFIRRARSAGIEPHYYDELPK